MKFQLLGPLEVITAHGSADVGSGKRRALLAYLLMHANEVVPADRLIDELWGEQPPATAAKSVQVYVSQLRKALRGAAANGDDVLLTRGSGYVLRVDPDALDAQVFERLVVEAQELLARGDAPRAAEVARSALELWRGPPLYDVAYEDFAQAEVARLEELKLTVLEIRIEAELELGEHKRLSGELEQLVAEHPLREGLRALLMLALYRCGRQSDALAVYREGRQLLHDELGLEPGPQLRELERDILNQSADLLPPRAPHSRPEPAADHAQEEHGRRSRAPAVVIGGALLLAAAAALAAGERSREGPIRASVALDDALNSAVAVDLRTGRPAAALPLPGRPTDAAAAGSTIWITTVDSGAVSAIDARRRKIVRTVPLPGRPDGVVISGESVWISDGSRGLLTSIRRGYANIDRRIGFTAAPAAPAPRAGRGSAATIAAAAGAVWLTNGTAALTRVDAATGTVTSVPLGARVTAVASGAGALWALGAPSARVLRIDPRSGRVTDRIPIVGRQGRGAAAPNAIAAAGGWVWVLNGNTATVTRIDAATRGVVDTTALGVERVPTDIAAVGQVAWVSQFDGTLTRIRADTDAATDLALGGALERVVATPSAVWTTTTDLKQQLPGGEG